ncbi:MAG TPA: hypothetical protein VLM85_06810 [Polyangiaceae bacterium]|nr:hypothetical protein [Polyangiaceae bacterium]
MTSDRRRLIFGAALAAALAAGSGALAAGPTAQDYETARVLYKEGKELRARGDLRGALEKLKAAHALGHTPITGVELAHTQEQLGMLVEARETCLGVGRMPVLADESKRSVEARDEAAKLADALKPRIASLRIRIAGVAAGATPIVTVDGEAVPAVSLDEPRKVNPGHHQVIAHVEGGAPVTVGVDLAEAQSREVTLAPPPAPVTYVPPPHGGALAQVHHGISGLSVAGIVVGGLGVLIGATTAIVAIDKKNQLNTACPNHACVGTDSGSLLDTAKTMADVSTVAFVVAGVGVVMLVIGLVTGGSHSEAAPSSTAGFSLTPEIGPGYAGVRGAF